MINEENSIKSLEEIEQSLDELNDICSNSLDELQSLLDNLTELEEEV